MLACCSAANLRGRPPTFFVLHALGGAIVFLTDGIMVRLQNQGPGSGVGWVLTSWSSCQGSYAGFVYTYAVSPPLLMGHKAAGGLDSIFWASITIGRLAFILVSYRLTAPRLLTLSLVGTFDLEGIRDGLEAGEPAQGSRGAGCVKTHSSEQS